MKENTKKFLTKGKFIGKAFRALLVAAVIYYGAMMGGVLLQDYVFTQSWGIMLVPLLAVGLGLWANGAKNPLRVILRTVAKAKAKVQTMYQEEAQAVAQQPSPTHRPVKSLAAVADEFSAELTADDGEDWGSLEDEL